MNYHVHSVLYREDRKKHYTVRLKILVGVSFCIFHRFIILAFFQRLVDYFFGGEIRIAILELYWAAGLVAIATELRVVKPWVVTGLELHNPPAAWT